MLEKIISTAYGQASFLEKHKVNKLLKQDDRLRELYEEYKRTANLVHSIDLEELNKEFIIAQKDSKERKSIIDEIYSIFLGKPLVYSAAVSVLIISIMFSIFSNRELSFNGYSTAEVERANIQSKQALMIVSNIFSKTGTTLKTDILYKEISKPINEGIKTVNKLFNKEN